MVNEKKISIQYLTASILMIFFVLSDLLFDFVFNFSGSNYLSFGFTILASITTFLGSNGVIKFEIKHKTDKISLFIKSNFNSPQVIFSILDIICGLITILSGTIFFWGIFKVLKIVYIPTKFIVVANKGKSLFKAISNFSLMWIIGRLLTNNFKGGIMVKTWIKNNSLTLTYCIIISPLSVLLTYTYINSLVQLELWANILIGVATFILTCILIILLGGDKVKQAVFRGLSKHLDEDNYEKVVEFANSLLAQQEIHQLALLQMKEEEKAKLNQTDKISAEQKQALINAEIEKIKKDLANK